MIRGTWKAPIIFFKQPWQVYCPIGSIVDLQRENYQCYKYIC